MGRDYEFRAPGTPQATGNEWHQPLWPAALAAAFVFAACIVLILLVRAIELL